MPSLVLFMDIYMQIITKYGKTLISKSCNNNSHLLGIHTMVHVQVYADSTCIQVQEYSEYCLTMMMFFHWQLKALKMFQSRLEQGEMNCQNC